MSTEDDDKGPKPLPKYAVIKGRGRCRVISYDGNGYFTVLTKQDVYVYVHRDTCKFTK